MDRRRAVVWLAACCSLWPSAGLPQQPKLARVGFLTPIDPKTVPNNLNALREGLRSHGYIEGRNLIIELAWSEETAGLKRELVADLINRKVDIIVTWGTPATLVASQTTKQVPIVMVSIADPIGSGLVSNLASPGGNITGLTSLSPDLSSKLTELISQIVPDIRLLAVLRNAANQSSGLQVKEIGRSIQALGLKHQVFEIRTASEIEAAFAAMTKARASAVLVLSDQLFISHAQQIAELAKLHRLPSAFERREHVTTGGLIAYGTSLTALFRRSADYVAKILSGSKPGSLPVEQPAKFELVVNVKTAKALGLTIPKDLLVRADEVIQ